MEKNAGKKFVTQGKLRENTGNFILARMWPPCVSIKDLYKGKQKPSKCAPVTINLGPLLYQCNAFLSELIC